MIKFFILYETIRMFKVVINCTVVELSPIFSFAPDLLEIYLSFLTVHMKVINFYSKNIFFIM
jgi:hypothetical protein